MALKVRMRDHKKSKEAPKVRYPGEKGSPQNKLRYELYRYVHEQLEDACEHGMLFEAIALCDMLITDRIEAYCQYLLHHDDLQFETTSIGNAVAALGSALKEKAPEVKNSDEWRAMEKRLNAFAHARNTALHSFILIKNAAKEVSLEERIDFVEVTAEDGITLARDIASFVSKRMVFES